MKLLVGLGNPGPEYAKHRHNIGFMVLDEFARLHQADVSVKQCKSLTTKLNVNSTKLMLAKPQNYMNCSGEAVRELMAYYKIEVDQLLVIHDEVDLELGQLRFAIGRGPGGNNGIRSLIEQLGTKDFCRLRFGVGRPEGRIELADYVLAPFAKQEKDLLGETKAQAVLAVEDFLREGLAFVQQKYH